MPLCLQNRLPARRFCFWGHNQTMRSILPSHPTPEQIEQSFYEALQNARIDALMACWSDEEEPVCIHPGGPRLLGHRAIRESFAAMFEHGPITVQPEVLHRSVYGACAVHSVLETVVLPSDDGLLEASVIATNVYVLTATGWRMAVHHASPGTRKPIASITYPNKVLH